MTSSIRLGYLVFDVRRPARWAQFCAGALGLDEPVVNDDGSLGYQVDDALQRLIVSPGRADDLGAIGLECDDDDALDALLRRLRGAGVEVDTGDEALRRARRVQRLFVTSDPDGNRLELFCGPQQAAVPFASPAVPGGFVTGALGLGHAALIARDPAAMEQFYVDSLGFGVSERLAMRVGPLEVNGAFLHCNRRHHSLALLALPLRRRLHHFMLQAAELRSVGKAFERAKAAGVRLSLTLGQHPDPDGTFSFYGATPSGFDYEIGAGGKEIDPHGWRELRTDVASNWGHKPLLRAQLKMAAELVAARFGR